MRCELLGAANHFKNVFPACTYLLFEGRVVSQPLNTWVACPVARATAEHGEAHVET